MSKPLLNKMKTTNYPKRVSVREIAEMAGVSIATVSRVINQNGRFSKETEERVKALIKAYDYQPNQLARSLRTKKAQVVGIIVPDITNEFFAQISLEIQQQLFYQHYIAIICNTNETYSIELEHLRMLRGQRVSGLIYVTGESRPEDNALNVPTIYIDRKPPISAEEGSYMFIESDNTDGGYLATKELLDKGCKKIGFVRLKGNISSYVNRFTGYQNALVAAGLEVEEKLLFEADTVSYDAGYQATKHLVESVPGIDGIFFTTDIFALGSTKYFREKNIIIPDNMKIVGFDDISVSQLSTPPITTIRQAVDTIAKIGVETLLSMIEGAPVSETYYRIPVQLLQRGTT